MANLERDDVEAALKRKGFVQDDRDHRYFKLFVGGKYTAIFTKTSTGKKYKTLGDNLVSHMARQVKLTGKQFKALVDCSLSAADYVLLLQQRGEKF